MNKTIKLNLIEGQFSSTEAQEVLLNIFSTKIQFHELKDFSSQERFGKPDEIAQKRIPELKKEVEKLMQILSEANTGQKHLVVCSEITISLSED